VARFSSVLLSALSTGGFFGTWTSLGPSTRQLTPVLSTALDDDE